MKRFIKENKIVVTCFLVLIIITLTSGGLAFYFYYLKEDCAECPVDSLETISYEDEVISNTFFMEVKGDVKKPGVYKVTNETIINEVITLAGGFTKTSYTNNINLSKKVSEEMVIYVYSKTEYKKLNTPPKANEKCITSTHEINNCINNGGSVIVSGNEDTNFESNSSDSNSSESSNSLVNINTASEKELTSISGIGESKAKNIINYRNENGLFKSIEDIKNVSGIGDTLYEQIKTYITI